MENDRNPNIAEENNAKFFENMDKEYQDLVQGIKDAQEFDKLCQENPESAKKIMLDGIRSDFWKYFKGMLTRTRYSMEVNLKRNKTSTLDQVISLGVFNNIYKQNDEVINMPINIVRQIERTIQLKNKQANR